MRCPRCGSSDFETRRESDGHNYTYDHSCRACEHAWWEPGGITLGRAMSADVSDPSPVHWVDGLAEKLVTNREYNSIALQHGLPSDHTAAGNSAATVAWDAAAGYAAAVGARLPTRHELRRGPAGPATWISDAPLETDVAAIRLARVDPTASLASGDDDERGARLLEAILAETTSASASPRAVADGPRLVYADHLQQRGDPRGEFIALQLARGGGPATERERELWSEHAPAWLGPLFPVLCPSATVVERGFLAACRVLPGPNLAAAIGDARWATVVELACDRSELITHPCMRSLRRLSADPHVLAQLARRTEPLAVESLTGAIAFDTAYDAWTAIAKLGALANVRAISIATRYAAEDHIVKRLFATPLGKQLAAIEITTPTPEYALETWLPALRRGVALARVRCRLEERWPRPPSSSAVVLERHDDELELRLEGTPSVGMLRIVGRLADAGLTPG